VLGELVDLIEYQLAHAGERALVQPRRAMMQRWADYLDSLRLTK
jgi:hypothetical protein